MLIWLLTKVHNLYSRLYFVLFCFVVGLLLSFFAVFFFAGGGVGCLFVCGVLGLLWGFFNFKSTCQSFYNFCTSHSHQGFLS